MKSLLTGSSQKPENGIIFESVNTALEHPRRGVLGYDRKLRRINKAEIDLENRIPLNSNQTFIDPDYAADTGRILVPLPAKKPKAIVLSSFMRSGKLIFFISTFTIIS